MKPIERSIIATLAYYDAFRLPLTLVEMHERLIPSKRLGEPSERPSLGELASSVDALVRSEVVHVDSGFYSLSSDYLHSGARRIERQKESAMKWKRMLRSARWLQMAPFVRALLGSGSMAYDATSVQSDWDFLVIVERRRLYTARAGLLLIAWLMGRLRTKRHRQAPDLFCFNHYLTTDGLALRHRSMFTGHGMAWLIPVMDEGHILERLWGANRWMEDVVPRPSAPEFVRRAIPRNAILIFMRRVFEFVLRSWIGSFVERAIQRWMQRRIMRDPATHARGGRVIADDFELEFHPHSFELVALNRYNATLKRYGMSGFTERDSGLRR